jgi:hypothetical protein
MAHSTANESQKSHRCGGTHPDLAHRKEVSWLAQHLGADQVFLLHSLTARLSEIPQRFSSSSLPPEFAAGRCAAIFIPALALT